MDILLKLQEGNKQWVDQMLQSDPQFFDRLSKGQEPQVLWIGCSDSRMPESVITKALPGEIFVHRNIANTVLHSDLNMLSVLDYAVNVLKVRHVIVCGHYGCGGVLAAMGNQQFGLVDNWIRHIKDVYRLHEQELEAIADKQARFDRLVELNVIERVFDLSKTSIIQNAWRERQYPYLHGWVYSLKDGLIRDLKVTMDYTSQLPPYFRTGNPVAV